MRRKPLSLLLTALLALPWLTGCWNRMEVEEAAYALAIGIDRGEQMPYSITVAIAKPGAIAGKAGGGKEDQPVALSTVEAPSLTGALSMLNSFIGRAVTMQHAKAVFLHEELARTDGVRVIDELLRFRETRPTMFFIVTQQPAKEFLEGMDPKLEKNPMRFFEQMTYHYRRNAMIPAESQLNTLTRRLDVAHAEPLMYYAAVVDEEEQQESQTESTQAEAGFRAGALPREGGAGVEMVGAAAFRRQRMVGVLTGDEVRHALILQDEFQQTLGAFEDPRDPEHYVSVQLSRGRPVRVQADLSGDRPRLSAVITMEAQLLGIQSGIDYSEPELQGVLEESIARQIEEPIREMIRKTQEWETDVVGFGRYLVPLFPTVDDWHAYRWPDRYPEAEFNIDVRVTLRRFGLTLSPVEPVE